MCDPCEENKPCTIHYTFEDDQHSQTLYSWYNNNDESMTCYTIGYSRCNIYPEYKGLITYSTQRQPGYITTNLIITNASRQGLSISLEGRWSLVAFFSKLPRRQLFTCDMKIYSESTFLNYFTNIF